jgi:hypothetical protein
MDEPRPSQSTRPLWPLLSLLAVIFVLGVLLTQVDLSKLISPLLAGKGSGRPESSAVMGVMLVVLIGLPLLALGLLVRALKRQARSSGIREEGKTAP